ncbi:MAG: aldose 1-epimerase family protein [Butyrivibrio sp.]|nr:aldose 1-epimerase family protein [Butyrivibrio sp.]
MLYNLTNSELSVSVNSHGAELVSVKSNKTDYEYMWQADPKYWKRTSPVLFPLVGNYRDKESFYNEKKYEMSQHGFARDMDFNLVSQKDDEIWLFLEENEDTLKKYPFKFKLEIGYKLEKNTVKVMWKVSGKDEDIIYFSIGAHPAFNCCLDSSYITFGENKNDSVISQMLNENGLITGETKELSLTDGKLQLSDELFAGDALVIEDRQSQSVSLYDNGKILVTVDFDAPLFGIWSPVGKHAPFMCIEPWYGRADGASFDKDLCKRKYGNVLKNGETFETSYSITFFS